MADSRGQTREAISVYRAAARRGAVWAQMCLGKVGREQHTLADRPFEPHPTPREAARWAEAAREDIAGSTRVLQTSCFAEPRAEAARQISALRTQARAGNAEADSLLRALSDRNTRT